MLSIQHIPEGRNNRSGAPLVPNYITVHNTDNSSIGADAEAHANFLSKVGYYVHNGVKRTISWHYTEICMNKGINQDRAFDRAKTLIACLCYDLNIDP